MFNIYCCINYCAISQCNQNKSLVSPHFLIKVINTNVFITSFNIGLHLTLFIEQPEYLGIFSPETGARISIQDPSIQPTPQEIGITATTGMATSIGVKQVMWMTIWRNFRLSQQLLVANSVVNFQNITNFVSTGIIECKLTLNTFFL